MALSKQQKEILKSNPNVQNVTGKQVHFTFEFKKLALAAYEDGWTPVEIFEKAGINLDWFRSNYAKDLLKNWRIIVKEKGMYALETNSGRPVKDKLPFDYDPEHVDELDKDELLQVIAHLNRRLGIKKISDPLPLEEWALEAQIKNSEPEED
jgi:hypothetical protein